MRFASPWLLLALLLVPLAVAGSVQAERRRARRETVWGAAPLLPWLVRRPPPLVRHLPAALFLAGVTFFLVGFARPQASVSAEREGATVVLVLDTSGSMAAGGARPTRPRAARGLAGAFLREVPAKYRVALVTFSDQALLRVPPTYERGRVAAALPAVAERRATALGFGIDAAVEVALRAVGPIGAAARPPAAVLLF